MARIQLTAIDTETQIAAHTGDLSLFGCFVETAASFSPGTKAHVRISHNGRIFAAEGRVSYTRTEAGLGIVFTSIEQNSVTVLDTWLTELRNAIK